LNEVLLKKLNKEPDNLKLRNEILIRNKRLIFAVIEKMINRYEIGILSREDLFQAGIIGLMKAIEKFDVKKKIKLSTYAFFWIKQGIQKEIFKNSSTIRIPLHFREDIAEYRKIKAKIISSSKRHLSKKEIEDKIGFKKTKIFKIEELEKRTISLDEKASRKQKKEEKGSSVIDLLISKNSPVGSAIEKKELKKQISKIISSVLNKREQTIIKMRFGFSKEEKSYTLQEVGKKLNLTRERIRQIQDEALEKLKKPFQKNNLQVYLE
jgi:RNA polymerase primary sigma factor